MLLYLLYYRVFLVTFSKLHSLVCGEIEISTKSCSFQRPWTAWTGMGRLNSAPRTTFVYRVSLCAELETSLPFSYTSHSQQQVLHILRWNPVFPQTEELLSSKVTLVMKYWWSCWRFKRNQTYFSHTSKINQINDSLPCCSQKNEFHLLKLPFSHPKVTQWSTRGELGFCGGRTLTPDCHENRKEDSGSVVKKVGHLGTTCIHVMPLSQL